MNKRSAIAVFLTALILLMPGCENYQSWTVSGSNHPKHESVGETLQFLIGDECNGRLVGTDGNLSAQRFLTNSLEAFGLEKYNDGTFNDEFSYNCLTINKIKLELAGKEFILGKDYFVNKISDTDVDLPLALQTKVEENCVVLLDDYGNIDPYLSDEKVKAILVKTDSPVMPFTPDEARISDKTVLYVTEDTYGYLKENAGGAIHLESRYSVAEKRDNNIIGMIKGNNAKKALVLSAHFDHVGSVGDQIFRGAVDNASGTAALLDIARFLSEKVKKDSLDMDIIFAFFNAEEIGKSGSKAFAEKIQSRYGYKNVTDINIDCVGSVEEKPLHICCSNENLREAARVLIKRLNGNFIPDVEESLGNSADSSDHVWFDNSIYIYTDSDIIRTLKDTIVNVNIKAIENISECVAGLVLNFPRNTEKGKSHEADKSKPKVKESNL